MEVRTNSPSGLLLWQGVVSEAGKGAREVAEWKGGGRCLLKASREGEELLEQGNRLAGAGGLEKPDRSLCRPSRLQ